MKTIVISAGHGGRDSGAVGNGLREKDANLPIALACRDYLNQYYEGHKLVMARTTDVYVSLPARRDLTARVNADRYISIHNNAYSDPAANGFDTHLSTGPLYGATRQFRDHLHDTVYGYVKTLGVRDRGKKFTNHDVTRMMPCPTCVMEYMFVTNPREAQYLKNPEVLRQLGKYTAIGVAKDLGLPKKAAPTPEPDWPTIPIPIIQRTIGVELDGKRTDEIGFLVRDPATGMLQTYVRSGFAATLPKGRVVGRGNYIEWTTE